MSHDLDTLRDALEQVGVLLNSQLDLPCSCFPPPPLVKTESIPQVKKIRSSRPGVPLAADCRLPAHCILVAAPQAGGLAGLLPRLADALGTPLLPTSSPAVPPPALSPTSAHLTPLLTGSLLHAQALRAKDAADVQVAELRAELARQQHHASAYR